MTTSILKNSKHHMTISALKVALLYAGFSILWILFSDQLLLLLVTDAELMTRIQMVKGWLFVFVTSSIIYVLLLRELDKAGAVERALKDKERDFLEVFNATTEGIVIHDIESGGIVDVNHSMLRMYGLDQKDVGRLTVGDLSSGKDGFTQADADILMERTLTEGPQLFEWHCKRQNGEHFWAEVTLKKACIGDVERIIAMVRDIDDRKKAEAKSEEYERNLQQAQKLEAMGTLAGGVAHDFNNILSAVLGYADLGRSEVDPESNVKKYLDEITKAGKRAKDLVRQILTFSRRHQPAFAPLHIGPIVKEAAKMLRASIPAIVDISTDIEQDCETVLADPTLVHQVIVNLCTNSYYAMREGGQLSITVKNVQLDSPLIFSVGKDLEPGKYVKLTVADTGAGMDEELCKQIFDPYFTTKKQGDGSGLGLSVVHGIVRNLGGGIVVSSKVGEGSVFDLYLPANSDSDSVEEELEDISTFRKTGRILLVDDEPVLIDLGKRVLEQAGYSVIAMADSENALSLFSAKPDEIDLIFSDMNMPHMDGLTLIKKCRELRPEIPAILYTGFSEMIDREGALRQGINDFLLKPIDSRTMVRSVQKLLQ